MSIVDIDRIDLAALVSEAQLIALAETLGGTRIYLPKKVSSDHRLARIIGREAAIDLIAKLGNISVRIPLARELRARHYRESGQSIARIARQLGMTENGVLKLLSRDKDRGHDQGQL